MKAKQVKHYVPLHDDVILKGHRANVWVWYEPNDYLSQNHPPGMMPYRLQSTSPVTRILKDGTFYTLNSKFIPRRFK